MPAPIAAPAPIKQVAAHDIAQVNNLRKSRVVYQNYVDAGGWNALRGGDKIEPGNDDPRIPAMRERLKAEGYYTDLQGYVHVAASMHLPGAKTIYDDTLAGSVKSFQARHGLADDGVVGPATLNALNESAPSKLARIDRTLAAWDGYKDLGDTHIWANIPSFKVQAWNNDVMDIEMKTIVGTRYTSTPAFSDEIEYMVANPKWFLPTSLFVRQKLKKLQADPSYAAKYNYRIYNRASGAELDPHNVNWFEPGISSKIQMVQDAGPTNALGNVKIIFPNDDAVYLHGTPDTHLFAKSNRALSSGCVRLEDPEKMAQWIANIDERVSSEEFKTTLDSKTRKHFPLAQHIPVHITYMTVTADPSGQVSFWQDIYGQDEAPIVASNVYEDYAAPYQSAAMSSSSPVVELN